jgi:hypothetical protein
LVAANKYLGRCTSGRSLNIKSVVMQITGAGQISFDADHWSWANAQPGMTKY